MTSERGDSAPEFEVPEFEPDYRFTLANERTFLAWERTALGLLAAAVAVVQLIPELPIPGGRHVLGVLLVRSSGQWRATNAEGVSRLQRIVPGRRSLPRCCHRAIHAADRRTSPTGAWPTATPATNYAPPRSTPARCQRGLTHPGTLDLYPDALAPLAELPVREIVSVTHTVSDVTLQTGEVVHDYLA